MFLVAVGSVVGWGLSIFYSYLGFKPDSLDHWKWYYTWMAIFMSFLVTVVELYLNSTPLSKVFGEDADFRVVALLAIGLAGYAYGIWTNIAGISVIMNVVKGSPWTEWVVPILFGTALEVAPEPLLLAYLSYKDERSAKKKTEKFQPQEQRRDDTRNKVRGHFEPRPVDRVPDEIRTLHKIPSAPMPRGNR